MLNAVVLHGGAQSEFTDFPEGEEILKRLMQTSATQMADWIPEEGRKSLRIKEAQVRGFSPAGLILDYAAENRIDMIVMGTHGRRWAARFFMGSVASEVVRHSSAPVLTLREQEPPRAVGGIDRILVPVDFSKHSLVALAHARDLAAQYDALLQILHVVEVQTYPSLYGPAMTSFDVNELKRLSFEAIDRALEQAPGPEVPYDKFVVSGRVASEIAAFAEEYESDMVVISTHGLSGLERVLTGSTTEQVVRLVECPVFTVKAFGKSLVKEVEMADLSMA
jgi:nucleotide-binding universal stress UspA family protein